MHAGSTEPGDTETMLRLDNGPNNGKDYRKAKPISRRKKPTHTLNRDPLTKITARI